MLALPGIPLARSRADAFDDLVLDAVEELESRWTADLTGIEFAVEDVPPPDPGAEFDPDVVMDRGIPLGRLYRDGGPPGSEGVAAGAGPPGIPRPMIVLYRRPVEIRASDLLERGDVVFAVVAELAAEYLGKELG
jgi:hypothetical protein